MQPILSAEAAHAHASAAFFAAARTVLWGVRAKWFAVERTSKEDPRHDLFGTARTDCQETARGGARGFVWGGSPMAVALECLGIASWIKV